MLSIKTCDGSLSALRFQLPSDFGSWESPQTLPADFIGPFEYENGFKIRNKQLECQKHYSNILNFSEGTAATYIACKTNFNKQSTRILTLKLAGKVLQRSIMQLV